MDSGHHISNGHHINPRVPKMSNDKSLKKGQFYGKYTTIELYDMLQYMPYLL